VSAWEGSQAMNFDRIVKRVSEVSPRFNDYALRGFVKEHIDDSPAFPAMIIEEGFKYVTGDLEFVGYTIMSPEERVKFELNSRSGKAPRSKIPLTVSHLRLVNYQVRFGDKYHSVSLYTPYLFDDMMYVRDKRSMLRKVILEKTLSRVQENDKDGVSVSPIRVNLMFNRRSTFKTMSYIDNTPYMHFVVAGRLYHGKITNKICDTTIVHYLLAKFGFLRTLEKFGLSKDDVSFVEEVKNDTVEFEYFAAKRFNEKAEAGPGLFLKVKRVLLTEDLSLKFVINLLYVLNFFKIQDIVNVYDDNAAVWKVILGSIILKDRDAQRAYSNAETNLKSVDHFIDEITRKRFETYGVAINDTYDLLVYIFTVIDEFMVNNVAQNIYNSRLDVKNGILVQSFAMKIFKNLYYLSKKSNIKITDVTKALSFSPMMFRQPNSSRSDDDKEYHAPPDIIGDNFLLSGGLNKLRLGGKPEQRLSPSMVVAESINAFVGKVIGKTGYLNPFIPTDKNGGILHPDYAKDIDDITTYLPR
jgi:hypothetical protein